jgi:hypothetical protein
MLMFLTILSMSLLALVLCAAAFAAATSTDGRAETQPARTIALDPPRFFARPSERPSDGSLVPIEVLLREVERHVRLEQAAAEAYLDRPTREALHSPTRSSLAN